MSNYDAGSILESPVYREELAAQRTFMARIFGWMTIGLLTTAMVSLGMDFLGLQKILVQSPGLVIVLFLVQFGVAIGLNAMVRRIPVAVAAGLFILYSLLTGVVFSILFIVYTKASIASTFFITAGTFGSMAAIGYTTKRDLTSMGSFLFMALCGLVIASIVNLFMQSTGLYWLLTYAGVLIFVGLTAYDVQKFKRAYAEGEYGSATYEKLALIGAFQLYLDFINLFIYLLRLLGSRRN